ncbi:helix-turn-helix transcriptional regulator [Vallitalea okinawensis]|uniref:helix-turn-helix transcriptional regulator n=1 Tax=Vallitalea okinawensis TaxID=2078660 RepID=UPI000CFB4183|nr:AraC family transcriptional regulator [Vallitalea okinawensis]
MIKLSSLPIILTCDYRLFKPGEKHITRRIKDYVLIFMLGGKLHFTEKGKGIELQEGQWYLQDSGLLQSANYPSDKAHYFYIHFSCMINEEDVIEVDKQGKFLPNDYMDIFNQLRALNLRSGIYRLDYEAKFLELFKQLILSCQKTADRKQIIANRVFRIVEENYTNDHLSNHLEDQIHLSYHYLYKLTRQYKGLSPIQYMHQLRINKAKELLSNTNETVENIAFHVGFNDISVFYKAFKKHINMSPNHWRVESRRGI